ncbi:50S ribosomal protein L25/general stress protein Ctc [Gemmatimonas groenlandica]|uniref:Large ribosomal subunit protein bL25 n=1 Tax=Gemmatimonas groenlandica TaxID=2732249 RepID=A0A6M4IP49_9BACT|nr:50S ribosomal protein L25/general stress protein Ctc [Gemmatimonas groenlandica]QJR35509.1 50S ribosomal protein L25/general stress protein Ctc [Gemmatimonas groenlandica]
MSSASLSASVRAETGKGAARKIRQAGSIPAVIYGHGREPQSLTINARDTDKLLKSIAISSTVIDLSIDGKSARTLIREVQRHPFKRTITHIDFQELVAGETVSVQIPIVYVGVPEGVRLEGGLLDQIMHQLHIEVDPSSIPNHIDVDVSALKIGNTLHVSDLTLPAGIKVLDEPGNTVCIVQVPKVAVEPIVEGAAEPEVIRAKPKADEK